MLPKKAEIVIVGGGVVGASLAYFLVKEGRDVVLLDKGILAGEASAANSAWAWTLTRRVGIDIRLSMHSVAVLQRFREELERDQEYRQPGGLLVITAENQIPFVEAHVKARTEDGFPLQMIDAKQARELEPLLSERILGAVFSSSTGLLNPISLVIALVEQARKLGAKIFYQTEVQEIGVKGGKVRGVLTSKGKIETETVVNAAGSWAGRVGEMVGLKVPISPYQMQMLITAKMPPMLSHCIMSASYMVKEYEKNNIIQGKDARNFGCAVVASQQKPGNLLLGATWEDVGFDKRTAWKHIEAIAMENQALIPFLKQINIIRSMANFFPFTTDDLPILGYVDGIEGFIMASGHNGHGILLGPGSAKLIQELICDGKTSIPLDEMRLSRFS
jgi:sarcosine oxidase subunit beta